MKFAKIEDCVYLRDLETNAIVNTRKDEIESFNIQRKRILQERREREETKNRLVKMEEEMSEIKQLLKELVQIRSSNAN